MIEVTEAWITTDPATAFLDITEAWIEASSTSGVTFIEVTEAWIEAATALNISPIAVAGQNQTVEPWSVVTVDGSASGDPDGGSITSWNWQQTVGANVTLTGSGSSRTFQAPASISVQTLTFSLIVSDGATNSTADTVDVTVLPVTERAVMNGVEVPLRLRAVSL